MANCDEGYLCQVCGGEVERLRDSDLYLRYVLGEVPAELLKSEPERHLRCNPTLAQFIVHPRFQPACEVEGVFSKRELDADYVKAREKQVTDGYERLLKLQQHRSNLSIRDYPFIP